MNKVTMAGVCLVISGLFGQPLPAAMMKVMLPHATSISGVTMPAGECTIENLRSDNSSAVLLIRSATGESVTLLASQMPEQTHKASSQTEVVLRRSGTKYELEKIRFAGMDYGYTVPRGRPAE